MTPVAVLPWHLAQFFRKTGFAASVAPGRGVWAKTTVCLQNTKHIATINPAVFKSPSKLDLWIWKLDASKRAPGCTQARRLV